MNQAEKERLARVGRKFDAKKYIKEEIEAIRRQVGDKKVLLAMSGGVDSSVCAVLLQKAIGKQLVCVFVDHGCMRLNEAREVKKVFKGRFGINLVQIDAEKRFLAKAKGITDPELKRKCIGGVTCIARGIVWLTSLMAFSSSLVSASLNSFSTLMISDKTSSPLSFFKPSTETALTFGRFLNLVSISSG